jgi:hypothetical protein
VRYTFLSAQSVQGIAHPTFEPDVILFDDPTQRIRVTLAPAAGVSLQGPFDRRARLCSVRVAETGLVEIIPMRHGGTRAADKGFHDRAEFALSVGHAPTTAELGGGVRQGLALSLWPPRPR